MIIDLKPPLLRALAPLLQQGAWLEVPLPLSLEAFLREELGIAPDTIRDRITTIFVDGKVVDQPAACPLHDEAVVALSAALPGLAGAALRRGGAYAALRTSITRRENDVMHENAQTGLIRLKLFNLLIDELGPAALAYGVVIREDATRMLLRSLGIECQLGERLRFLLSP